uniref:Wall-associated receptor kinase galacturonan-binding domain-containing protein n=1 Tax=Leersia perrieri TaxID=77586 RepID=A0A0D9WGF9_9ORYZ
MASVRPYLAALLALFAFSMVTPPPPSAAAANVPITTCRSFCGNLTVDYPFALHAGCGHAGFRDLLFCINGALMLHLPSGSYRVLDIDYAYRGLTLHDPAMSDCRALDRSRAGRGNGFVVEPWRAPYLAPDPDNVFLLLGCRATSPLFQGFPDRHLPCRNVSGMGCGDYYDCPAWEDYGGRRPSGAAYGASVPPECCAVSWDAIRAVNVSRLECEGYSSAYSLAPVRAASGPRGWAYGIRVSWALPEANRGFCGACRATGGVCGHDVDGDSHGDLCLCGDWNSTSNCDSSADAALSNAATAAPRAIAALCWAVLASGFSIM